MEKTEFYYTFRNEYLINSIEYYSKKFSVSRQETIKIFEDNDMEKTIDENIDVIQQLDLDQANEFILKLLMRKLKSKNK